MSAALHFFSCAVFERAVCDTGDGCGGEFQLRLAIVLDELCVGDGRRRMLADLCSRLATAKKMALQ